jgi:RHS repeat-associated protein
MYLYDGIGNPVGVLTDTGTRAYSVAFDPYGGQTVTAGGNSDWYGNTPYGFKAGTRTDGDALVKFGLRWYLPTTGTWTQRDTLDAPLDPTNANRYAYAGDDPIDNADPSGALYLSQAAVDACLGGALGSTVLAAVLVPEEEVTGVRAVATAVGGCAVGLASYQTEINNQTFSHNLINDLDASNTLLDLLKRLL